MKVTTTIITTIEIEKAEKELLRIEYSELSKLLERKMNKEYTFDTINELIENLLR
ncbi:hypothetical protein LCGC14_0617550 [marine sediment metagenome]|uniref:Uncharacterized protein n=1 Tax=marine sediment metagenome TaxID=412755 RepID=A0A0F9UE93_9ZZZZ